MKNTILKNLVISAVMAALQVASVQADVCDPGAKFAIEYQNGQTQRWTGERNRFCTGGGRVRRVDLYHMYDPDGDWDSVGMGMNCCSVDAAQNVTADTCSDKVVVPQGSGKWGYKNEDKRYASCDDKPGGYVAGFRLYTEQFGSGDFQSKYLTLKCCYPAVAPPAGAENCDGGYRGIADGGHWSGMKTQSCNQPGGYIKGVMFSQLGYDTDDKEETGMGINCCTLNAAMMPSGGSTGGTSTAGPAPSDPGLTGPVGSTTSTVPDVHAPFPCSGAKGASGNNAIDDQICNCKAKGAIFTATGAGSCDCPTNYEVVQTTSGLECLPSLPPEMVRSAANYPVCGPGRIPVKPNATSFPVLQAASNQEPRYNGVVNRTGNNNPNVYKYATGSDPSPHYLYEGYNHCACSPSVRSANPQNGIIAEVPAGATPRFPVDTFNVIKNQDKTGNTVYGPVAIAKNEDKDGRLGLLFSKGYSQCECPNLNEQMVATGSDSYASGYQCKSLVDATSNYRVLVTYDPARHDLPGTASQVMNRSGAQKSSDGHPIKNVTIGDGAGGTTKYARKIWTCMDPFSLNTSNGECYFDNAKNACGEGNGVEIPASEVSANVAGPNTKEKFLNTVNKKLACCLNQFGTANGNAVKFDCAENLSKQYTSFDALWTSADQAAQGGQLNAILLTNAQGKWLSGFYTRDGTRCEGFSEFAGALDTGLVNPADGIGAQMKRANNSSDPNAYEIKGSIPLPGTGAGSGGAAYTFLKGKMIGLNQKVPTSAQDRRRCPVLVRAALATTCPTDPIGATAIKTYVGPPRQCSSAETVEVHIRVEQIWEIAGQPKMSTIDTIVNGVDSTTGKKLDASEISISRIIANKYGNACPPGQHRGADSCEYD